MPPAPRANTALLIPNRVAPTLTSNRYNDHYLLDSDDDPVFKKMVDSKTVNPINIYIVVPQPLTLDSTPPTVFNKQRKIRGRTRLATIKRAHSDTTASARFLLTALYSVSQAITRANTKKLYIDKNKDTACCAD